MDNIPKEWIECSVGDILYLKNGYAFSSAKYIEKGIPLIRISDIQNYKITVEETVRVEENDDYKNYIVENGDILIAMSGATTGKYGIYNGFEKIYQNQRVGNLKPYSKTNIEKKYIYYLLGNLKREVEKRAYGGAQPNISATKIETIEINLPPLAEQKEIVSRIEELFSELDNGIENLKKAKEQIKTYRQSLLKNAFEGKLTEKWRKENADKIEAPEILLEKIKEAREEHYLKQIEEWEQQVKEWEENGKEVKKPSKPPKLKDMPEISEKDILDLPKIPQIWNYTYLTYSGELGRGKSKHRPRNDKKLFGGNYPFIQTGEVKAANKVLRTFSQTYNEFGLSQSKLWEIGTLCITIAANIAETCFLGIKACFPDSIVGFTGYKSVINSKYIDYFIQSTKKKIQAYAPATAQKNINLTILENMLFPICSLPEQNQIVQIIEEKFSVCDKLEETIDESLEKSEFLRQSILKKAFSGELTKEWRKRNPDLITGENSAENLLKRIKAEKEAKK